MLLDTEVLTIVVLCVNIGALVFVGVQTLLTRRALVIAEKTSKESQRMLALTEKTFKESKRTKEITDLPQGGLILSLKVVIDKWREELQAIVNDEKSIKTRVKKGDKSLGGKYGKEIPEGVVEQWLYDNSPRWMQVIYISAAQYYFHCKGAAFSLLSMPNVSDNSVDDLVEISKWGVERISEILAYIDERLPEWYLDCPASLSESRFFKNNH